MGAEARKTRAWKPRMSLMPGLAKRIRARCSRSFTFPTASRSGLLAQPTESRGGALPPLGASDGADVGLGLPMRTGSRDYEDAATIIGTPGTALAGSGAGAR